MYLSPGASSTLGREGYFQLSNFLAGIKGEATKSDEVFHVIDDEVLNEFIKFYSNKSIDNIEIFEKEEIRYILESIGRYNIDKLSSLLKSESEKKEEKICKLLNENLFDEQLMILDELLK